MSSHHNVKFFINHYEQQGAAAERKLIKAQMRELQKQESAIKWSEYRHKKAVIEAAARFAYYSEVAFGIGFILTVFSIVLYGLRNI